MASDKFDFLDDFGIDKGATPENRYEEFIKDVGTKITKDLRSYIESNAYNTGGLAQSVVYFPKGSLSFEIQADSYYKFMDEGVNAIGTNNMGSSYSFKAPFVSSSHARAIQEWKGLGLSHAYAVAMNNKKKGLKGHNITDNVITDKALEDISKDLAEVTGLNFELSFEKHLKEY